jgi:hypothetical protein
MTHESYDPRDDIREAIGISTYDFDAEETIYTIHVTDSNNETVEIPLYNREDIKSGEEPNLPYVSMALAYVDNDPHNVSATVRKFKAYVDLDIAYVATANINVKRFGKKIKDALHNLVRTHQATTNKVFFMNIENEKYIDELNPRQMVFHYILTLEAEHHDAC